MKRRYLLLTALAVLLGLCSCAARAQEQDESGYELYYLAEPGVSGGDAIAARSERYVPDETMTVEECARALVEQLLSDPRETSLRSPVPEGTTLQSLTIAGRRARLDFSAQYGRLSGIDLSLADYCVTLTLTQLPDVNAVSITANGRELPYRKTQVLLAADTLLSSRESGLRPITVQLYFLDTQTGALRAEQQTLALYEGQTRVSALLDALAQGPEDDTLSALLPEELSVLSSRIEDGVCYLNLPDDTALPQDGARRQLLLESLVRSLCSLSGVERVQFMVEGENAPDLNAAVSDEAGGREP